MDIPGVPPLLLQALHHAAGGQRLALVGGVVRDLLLHRHHCDPWRGLPDLDLVVEGDVMTVCERLRAQPELLELRCLKSHKAYGTAELEVMLKTPPGEGREPIWLIDLASARRERYPNPADNPVVCPGDLDDDLARRDFSINAMAMVLHGSMESLDVAVVDPYGGQRDLAAKRLRLLHSRSFQDDPTRLIRAARYAARLGFDLAFC